VDKIKPADSALMAMAQPPRLRGYALGTRSVQNDENLLSPSDCAVRSTLHLSDCTDMNFYQYSCCVDVVRVVADYVIVSPFVSQVNL